ncbi:MAG: hypothetical protein ACRDK7_09525 [Solirubrobacteraceae bacterium]
MSPEEPWPPQAGKPLPRAGEAYADPEKLAWILSNAGHGREWARVLYIGGDDIQRFWDAIAHAVIDAPLLAVRDVGPHSVSYEVRIRLTLGVRSANALTAWHYANPSAPPRLVTAYPKP